MIRSIQFLTTLVLLLSCSKDEPTSMFDPMDMESEVKTLLLKEIMQNDKLVNSYIYNPDSTVMQTSTYSSTTGEPRFISDITYIGTTSETIVTNSSTGELNSTIKISSLSDDEVLEQFFDSEGQLSIYNIYTVDTDCGFSNILTADSFGNLLPSTRAEYTDENCSNIHYSKFGDNLEYIRWEYTRNDKLDPRNITKHPLLRVADQKMTTKLVRKTQDGTTSTNLSYEAEIEYNEFDYPVKETRTYRDGDLLVYTYEYY